MTDFIAADILRGYVTTASYRPQVVSLYADNPLIEALPEILSEDDFIQQATYLPPFDPDDRLLPTAYRLHTVMTLTEIFQPLSQHIDLEQRFSRVIRMGYRRRNPQQPNFWQQVNDDVQTLREQIENKTVPPLTRTNMLGFTMLGISGIGKTAATEAVLATYPQIIRHHRYREQPFHWTQVVWLKLDCPYDSSTKGLCINFFVALDNLLQTRYYHTYARDGRATVNEMLPSIARLAFTHSIGVLVIDEVQRLSTARSGGAEKMLNFFVQVINTIGLPIVLVGTPRARAFLSADFAQIRRASSQGAMLWHPLSPNLEWELVMETLWSYQYLSEFTPLTPILRQRIFTESAGIIDFAIKLYLLTQIRAISHELPNITEDLLVTVARECFSEAQPMLDALRRNDQQALQNYDDIQMVDPHVYAQQVSEEMRQQRVQRLLTHQAQRSAPDTSLPRIKRQTATIPSDESLVAIGTGAKAQGSNPYAALQAAGYLRPLSEFADVTSDSAL